MPANTRPVDSGIKRWSLSRLQKRRIDFDLLDMVAVSVLRYPAGQSLREGQSLLVY
jgi:hypothetical protein